MHEIVVEAAAEVVAVVLFTLGAGVLAVAGVLTEQAGVANLSTGHVALGAWEVLMGGLALFVGLYLLGYREVLPRLRGLVAGRG